MCMRFTVQPIIISSFLSLTIFTTNVSQDTNFMFWANYWVECCFRMESLFWSLRLCVYLFDTEQEHVDVRVQLIHPLQLDDIDSTKRFQDLVSKIRVEYHPHWQLHDTFVLLHFSSENLQSLYNWTVSIYKHLRFYSKLSYQDTWLQFSMVTRRMFTVPLSKASWSIHFGF